MAESGRDKQTSGSEPILNAPFGVANLLVQAENEALRKEIQELTQANHALTEEANEAKDIRAKMSVLQSTLAGLAPVTKQEPHTPRVKRERSEGMGTPAQVAKKSKPSYVVLED